MDRLYDWRWVERQVTETIEIWHANASPRPQTGRHYTPEEQQNREEAYDNALQTVEEELRLACRTRAERLDTQARVTAAFARFSATALDLKDESIRVLTDEFLPVGTQLARWARRFDDGLSMADIVQACRNAWTACGLQPLLGVPLHLTPSILAYSLLYPYSDNFLDEEAITPEAKLRFSERFRRLLRGESSAAGNDREKALHAMIGLIEAQYPRAAYPQVFDCLLAIHQAQEHSIGQISTPGRDDIETLRMSCAKGGTSVLADACLVNGRLTEAESRFAFEWGVLLQLGDDLQDIGDDMRRGSVTLFSRAAARGTLLDGLAIQLLNFSEKVADRMDRLPHGTPEFKELLKMSWRSLILMAVAESREFFSPVFLKHAEYWSPFRFEFLRARRDRLAGRQGLYTMLFNAFLDDEGMDGPGVPHLDTLRGTTPLSL